MLSNFPEKDRPDDFDIKEQLLDNIIIFKENFKLIASLIGKKSVIQWKTFTKRAFQTIATSRSSFSPKLVCQSTW